MIQQSYFWVYIQRKWNYCLKEISAPPPPMLIAVLFTTAKIRKQRKCPSTNEWIKQIWYIYTRGYYSATKKKEILPFVTTWKKVADIMPSEIRQRKINTVWSHLLYVESKKVKLRQSSGGFQELGRRWEWGEFGQRVRTFSYEMNKFWGSHVQHGDST